jgi:cyclic pyranopterin phosphate synthase
VLVDSYGRIADDLRISVTDRCNLRCVYCMPADGMRWLERGELLTFDEIERLVAVFVRLGVRTVRITGGEPLVRRGVVDLVARLARLRPRPELALTTNGVLLAPLAAALADAGLDRVNVSLDSLRPDRAAAITRRDSLAATLAGCAAATAAGLRPVKINCVVQRSVNDDELVDFARFARTEGYVVRFIEYMPLDADGRWRREDVVAATEMLAALEEAGEHPDALDRDDRVDPAARYRIGDGEIGVIPTVTDPFCASCNRLRVTSDGGLRTCLFAHDEVSLRDLLRAGADDTTVEAAIRDAVAAKWAGHAIGTPVFVRPTKSMSQIGG